MDIKKGYESITASEAFHRRTVDVLQRDIRTAKETGVLRVKRRTVAIFAAACCAALLIGAVFAIPSARAEVLRWFGASSPAEYLTADPDERPDVPELEALVASPAPVEDEKTGIRVIPIDRTDPEVIPSEKALAISDFLYENCDIELGGAVYDGENFYQSIRLNGLSGQYLLYHFGDDFAYDLFAVPVDPYAVWGLYENGPEEEYLTGEKTLYEFAEGYIWYELPDGKRWRGVINPYEMSTQSRLYREIKEVIPRNWDCTLTEEQENRILEIEKSFLTEENGITAVAIMDRPQDFGINKYIDENGYLTVKVYYQVYVIEAEGYRVPDTDLFWAELGTISINMNAEESLTKRQLKGPDEPVALGTQTLTISMDEFVRAEEGIENDRVTFTKHRVSTEGVYFTAETENATVDALYLRNIRIRAILPDSWTESERKAFAASAAFRIRIDGEGDQYVWYNSARVQKDSSVEWIMTKITGLPLELLRDAKRITFTPELWGNETIDVTDADGNLIETLDPAYGETALSAPGARGYKANETRVALPDCEITLTVQP